MNLFDRIKEERERLGHSQTEFAAIAGASKHSQINWEKGETAPNATVLAAWAKLGVDIYFIITGVRVYPDEPVFKDSRERTLLDNYRDSDEEGRTALEKVAAAFAYKNGHLAIRRKEAEMENAVRTAQQSKTKKPKTA